MFLSQWISICLSIPPAKVDRAAIVGISPMHFRNNLEEYNKYGILSTTILLLSVRVQKGHVD